MTSRVWSAAGKFTTVLAPPASRRTAGVRQTAICKGVEVAEIGDHQAPLVAIHREMMRDAIGFARGVLAVEGEDGALPNEMHCGRVLVQVSEHGRERLARMQLLRGVRIFVRTECPR